MFFPWTSTSWVAQKCGMTQDMRFSSRDRHLSSNINMWARCPSSHSYVIVSGSQRARGQPQELSKQKHLMSFETPTNIMADFALSLQKSTGLQFSQFWASGVWPLVLFNFCEIFSLFFKNTLTLEFYEDYFIIIYTAVVIKTFNLLPTKPWSQHVKISQFIWR